MNYFLKAMSSYAVFEGRARRAEYWYFLLWYYVFMFGTVMLDEITGVPMLQGIYVLATFIPMLAVGVRRMHDVGHSGWWLLVPIYSLVCMISAGDTGPNQYGPDPKADEHPTDELTEQEETEEQEVQ